jgi:hypothetical protein
MRRKFRLPSPALVISFIALVVAMSGTALAAVNYARNAGAVDGKSAVADGASLRAARGRIVATQRAGDAKGTIGQRYLDLRGLARGATATFGRAFEVADNAEGAPTAIGGIPGLGTLTAQCNDQDQAAGKEDPLTVIAFADQSGEAINLSRTVGNGDPLVAPLANGAQTAFTIGGSNTFALHIERRGVNYLAQGVVRQDGRGTAAATCLVYGFALAVGG